MSEVNSSLEEAHDSDLRLRLEVAESRLRLLSAHTSGIIFELNTDARFVRVWASDPALLACPEGELIGRTVIEALGPELGSMHDALVREALYSGKGNEYEYELEVPSGVRHFAASSVVVPATPDNAERAVIIWVRDITDQVRTRTKLLQSQRLAAVGRLAAEVAHEVNNPLGYMLLNIERMRRQVKELAADAAPSVAATLDEMSAALALVSEGGARVNNIVRDLTNFARIEDSHKRVELGRALALALDLSGAEEQTQVQVSRDFGPVPEVMADEGRLVQVFLNLIDNAVRAILQQCPPGTVKGALRVTTRTDEHGRAIVEVQDSGVGIPRHLHERIFEPFYTTTHERVGLGLTLCQTLIISFAGELSVQSDPGRGTTFCVTLPAANARLSEQPLAGS